LRHNLIGTEHLLLGLVRAGDGMAAKIIIDRGVRLDDLRDATIARLDKAA
jgi:ATP-dependent Clp protease ATP-binding subunit ClpC